MKICKVLDEVRRQHEHENANGEMYVCDILVNAGYGQTTGGYRERQVCDRPSQKTHFLKYYGNKGEKNPAFYYLRCPELLLFICELAGVPRDTLEVAAKVISDYEDEYELLNTAKSGNYVWGKQVFRDFKKELKLTSVVRIIRTESEWIDVRSKITKLFED